MAVNSPVDPKQSPAATEAGETEGPTVAGVEPPPGVEPPGVTTPPRGIFSSLSSICKLLDMARRLLSISSSFRS